MTRQTNDWLPEGDIEGLGSNRLVDLLHQTYTRFRTSSPRNQDLFASVRKIAEELRSRRCLARIEFLKGKNNSEDEKRSDETQELEGQSFLPYLSRRIRECCDGEDYEAAAAYTRTRKLYERFVNRLLPLLP